MFCATHRFASVTGLSALLRDRPAGFYLPDHFEISDVVR
jgi:hypothetical protein